MPDVLQSYEFHVPSTLQLFRKLSQCGHIRSHRIVEHNHYIRSLKQNKTTPTRSICWTDLWRCRHHPIPSDTSFRRVSHCLPTLQDIASPSNILPTTSHFDRFSKNCLFRALLVKSLSFLLMWGLLGLNGHWRQIRLRNTTLRKETLPRRSLRIKIRIPKLIHQNSIFRKFK